MSLRPYLLAIVALGLAVLVAAQYWPVDAPVDPSAPTAAPLAKIVMLNPLSQRPEADFAALFDRPLFDPTRSKPVLETSAAPAAPETPTQVEVTPAQPPQPVLMGTVTSPWPGGAYLGDDAGGPIVFLRPGQAAMGLHLEEVRPKSALFMGPDGEVTLQLRPNGADGAATGTNASASPPTAATIPSP